MFSVFSNELYKIFHSKRIYVFSIICIAFAGLMFIGEMNENIAEILVKDVLMGLLPIFFAIILAESFTEEYKAGTLKLTLIQPISRSKYLIGKILALVPVGLFLIILNQVLGMAVEFIKSGNMGLIAEGSSELFINASLSMIPILAFSMIILLLSIKLNSSGAVIGGCFGLMMIFQLSGFFASKYNLQEYIITNHFKMFFERQNLANEMMVVAAYFIVFLTLSLIIFNKKDITE